MKKKKRLLLAKYIPKKSKFARLHKGTLLPVEYKKNVTTKKLNGCALIALKSARLNIRFMEVARLLIARKFNKKKDKKLVRINTSIPVTKKPNENRMGKGKGQTFTWISKIASGRVLLEFLSKNPNKALAITKTVKKKLKIPACIQQEFKHEKKSGRHFCLRSRKKSNIKWIK